jgi:hypothetical protein
MGGKGSGRKPKMKPVPEVAPEMQITHSLKTLEPTAPSVKDKIESLKFIRIYDLKLIPKYLFEQVKPQNFDLNEVYAMAPNFETSPLMLLYALADEEHKIKGFLWGYINSILKTIDVDLLTVDKEYQDNGQIMLEVKKLLSPIKEKIGYRAFRIITQRPRALSRFGFKKTGEIIMELED